jgi:peptidoglycan/xylan/chitin deacetylase (PgdA/CDA1 family)
MITHVVRHALAPHVPAAAAALGVPQTIHHHDPGASASEPAAPRGVALTFDDGPHPEGTPAVLDALARAGARATFFVVGEQVERRPKLVAEIAGAGHLVALHGYRHRLQLRLGARAVRDDFNRGIDAVVRATGADVGWHRPPFGIYSATGLQAVFAAGLRPLLWSRWGKDWRRFTTPERIAARATRDLSDGDVILLHDADFYSSKNSHRRTVAALPTILSAISHMGLATVLPT